jgi:predicted site-specific integrase-resolvase
MQATTNNKEQVMNFTTSLSPYAFAGKVGKRPQMVYNYIKNGMIKTRTTETGKMVLDPEEMTKWATKWAKKAEEAAK